MNDDYVHQSGDPPPIYYFGQKPIVPDPGYPQPVLVHSSWVQARDNPSHDGAPACFLMPDYQMTPWGRPRSWNERDLKLQAMAGSGTRLLPGNFGPFQWWAVVNTVAEQTLVQSQRVPAFADDLSNWPQQNAQPDSGSVPASTIQLRQIEAMHRRAGRMR
jgi:hypothetical protein